MEKVEVTEKELECLTCPTVAQQEQNWKLITDSLTESKIAELIESLNFKLLSFKPIDNPKECKSFFNPIYIIKVENKNSIEKLVLKIIDPLIDT